MTDENVDIRIELPLPIDITGTLINVIGLTWPNAVIKDDGNDKGWRSENRLVLSIPPEDRHKSAKKAEKYAKVKAHLTAETEAFVNELDPNAFSLGLPQWLADQFVAIAKVWHAQYPADINYLESRLREKDTNQEWVFYVAKAKDRTPHALREKAEARVAELEAELSALKEKFKVDA
ncbi:hypothetical protein SEA_ARCHIE_124 [Mycobacterium phage Archie]|uniref:Uncharacterized protein n=1 Tax=Mycobacterium phage Archie TaxID=1718599 RepID=A0A0M4QU59_9CAUD|nr:hypothetical protein AVU85_gp119 [Mycobacterium phage Archie]ALF00418.1 hypothetical protein SEA_ARCHIE_124 [Mycobacterium phage Archie]